MAFTSLGEAPVAAAAASSVTPLSPASSSAFAATAKRAGDLARQRRRARSREARDVALDDERLAPIARPSPSAPTRGESPPPPPRAPALSASFCRSVSRAMPAIERRLLVVLGREPRAPSPRARRAGAVPTQPAPFRSVSSPLPTSASAARRIGRRDDEARGGRAEREGPGRDLLDERAERRGGVARARGRGRQARFCRGRCFGGSASSTSPPPSTAPAGPSTSDPRSTKRSPPSTTIGSSAGGARRDAPLRGLGGGVRFGAACSGVADQRDPAADAPCRRTPGARAVADGLLRAEAHVEARVARALLSSVTTSPRCTASSATPAEVQRQPRRRLGDARPRDCGRGGRAPPSPARRPRPPRRAARPPRSCPRPACP